MRKYSLLSWNVNGIRAVEKKGFTQWLQHAHPDILALQETKAHPDQLSQELLHPSGYSAYWNAPVRKGYSGVAVFTKQKPEDVAYGFGVKAFDQEGRILILYFEKFILMNIYFPNGQMGPERLRFKLTFYGEFLKYAKKIMKQKKMLIVCGDLNTAHREIDIARPKKNETVSGFLPEERAWLDKFIAAGLIDTFRIFNQEGGHYTWWDPKFKARERNVGWRLDYFYVDKESVSMVQDAFILTDVHGSDHCPVGITICV